MPEISSKPPMTPKPSRGCREGRPATIILGCVLIVAFLMPTVITKESKTVSDNTPEKSFQLIFEYLNEDVVEEMPFLDFCLMVFPLLAGVAIIIAAFKASMMIRGIIMIVLAPLLFLKLSAPEPQWDQVKHILPPDVGGAVLTSLLILIGLICLLGGILGRRRVIASKFASFISILGGIFFLAGLILSIFLDGSGSVLPVILLKMMLESGMGVLLLPGIFCLGSLILWGVSSFFCFLNFPGRPLVIAKKRNRLAFLFFLAGLGAIGVTTILFLQVLLALSDVMAIFNKDAGLKWSLLMAVSKSIFWHSGLFLLLPFGLADLAAALRPPTVSPESETDVSA